MHVDWGPDDRPAGGRRDAARSVSAELDEIFHGPPAPAGAGATSRVQSIEPAAARPASPSSRAAQWGGVAAAALAGLAFGAVLMDPRAPRPANAPAQAPATSTPLKATSAPPQPPVLVAKAPPSQAPPADVPNLVFTPIPETPRQPAVQKAVQREPVAKARPKAVKAKATTPAKRSAGSRCERLGGGARARCAYPAVLEADRRLRRAYAEATRAGVERGRLVSYRNRWASLRHRADDQPGRVIAAYSDMARDLDRMAREARS